MHYVVFLRERMRDFLLHASLQTMELIAERADLLHVVRVQVALVSCDETVHFLHSYFYKNSFMNLRTKNNPAKKEHLKREKKKDSQKQNAI